MAITMTLAALTSGLLCADIGTSPVTPAALATNDATFDMSPASPPAAVMCGNVRQWNGEATLLADADRGGIVYCQEGLDVVTEYLMFAPGKGSGPFSRVGLQ